jgi:hypothetical protein
LRKGPPAPLLFGRRGGGRPSPSAVPGSPARYLALAVAIAAGILIAAVTMHRSAAWTGGFGFH